MKIRNSTPILAVGMRSNGWNELRARKKNSTGVRGYPVKVERKLKKKRIKVLFFAEEGFRKGRVGGARKGGAATFFSGTETQEAE